MQPHHGPVATIDRLDCAYLVPDDHPGRLAVGVRLDAVARGPLVERCAGALTAELDPADPAVWVIRRLDVGVSLPIGAADPDVLARLWAQAIATGIGGVVRREVSLPAGDAIWYPDRAAYLAAFAADLAAGAALDAWQYAVFAGLRSVPPGQAIVGAAGAGGVPVVEVVARLARAGRLAAVLAAVTVADARAIWHACLDQASTASVQPALAAVWEHRGVAARSGEPPAVGALRLLGAVLADHRAPADPGPVVHAVAQVANWMAGARDAGADIGSPTDRRWSAGPDAAAPEEEHRAPTGTRAAGPTVAADRPQATPHTGRRPDDALGHPSPYAGVLLLVPSLVDAGLDEASRTAAPDAYRAAVLRHRVLVRCLGVRAATAAAADPALRLAVGLDPADSRPGDLAGSDPDRIVAALVSAFAAQGRLELATISIDALPDPVSGAPLALLRTVPDDLWLALGTGETPRTRAMALEVLASVGLHPDNLVEGDASAAGDLHFLGTGSGDELDLAITVMARAGVRLFARRLLGFGRASAAHLAANAYSAGGVVRAGAGGDIEVALEPSPLQVVLNLAGLDTMSCPLPWTGGRLLVRTIGARP